MISAYERSRYRFSLLTLLSMFTLACMWLGSAVNWVQQREKALAVPGVFAYGDGASPLLKKRRPLRVWLMGGKYVEQIQLPVEKFSPYDVERYRSLFPEANVSLMAK